MMRRRKFLPRLSYLITLVVIYLQIEDTSSFSISNTVRYGMQEASSVEPMLTSLSSLDNRYKINSNTKGFHRGRLLQDEDQDLLEEFYRETKSQDPYVKDEPASKNLWNNVESNSVVALSDLDDNPKLSDDPGWSIDLKDAILQGEMRVPTKSPANLGHNYSPTLRLLTSYSPVSDMSQRGKILGSTLYGQGEGTKPSVNSNSAKAAIKLHDELLEQPPNDGRVRVRMYYHRAIHDDAQLYGTGPWKYWGHGWGVEFGYNPKEEDKKSNFYQRGYTIERAFGRDFCKDNANCRQSDPAFFNDPLDVGSYSKQQAKLRAKTKYTSKIHSR